MISKSILALTTSIFLASFNLSADNNKAAALNDSQILHIIQTINNGEISLARDAEKKAQAKGVKNFAKDMEKDHGTSNKEIAKLGKKLNLDLSAESDVSGNLKKTVAAKTAEFKGLKDAAFDTSYAQSQVAMHQEALNLIDANLIPSASSPEIAAYLKQLKETVSHHMDMAKTMIKS